MTDEELDLARAKQAWRTIYRSQDAWERGEDAQAAATEAARLARIGWVPPEPVDPDLIEARKIVSEDEWGDDLKEEIMRGAHDRSAYVRVALNAIKRGRGLANGRG